MAQCIKSFGASLWLLHIWHILTYQRNISCSEKGESTHNTVNTSPVSSTLHLFGLGSRGGAYHSNCPNFHNIKWRYYSVAIRFASAEFSVAVVVVGRFSFILLSSILLPYNPAMATDRPIVQRIIIEHTEISIITTKMEYFVPDSSSLQYQIPVGRANRRLNPQPAGLPVEFQDVNSSNNPDILAQNALHPSGIYGTRLKLDTSLLNTMSHLGPTLSNLDAPHPPVHADFINTNQSVPEPPAHTGANIQHSFATIQSPSYTTSYSNVNLQEDTAYSNLLEPQATLSTSDFDPYKTNNMGGFTIKEESLDCGYSPYTVLPHQQPLSIANNSNLYPIMTAESYNDGPLCPFPQIEPQKVVSSGTSATLNVLAEQQPMSNKLESYSSESTTASTDVETSIPPYVATNTSVPSGREQFGIHTPQESFNERCLPSEMDSGKSPTGSSISLSHGCATNLYLPKMEDFEDMGLSMDTAMQITPEISDLDLDDQSPRNHLFPGGCNFTTANLSDDLPTCHTMNNLVEQEDDESSNASMEPPCISNDVSPNIRNIWQVSTHADAPVNADSDTSVENNRTRSIGSIEADLSALFAQWTKGKDYDPDRSSTRETSDVNAPNPYNVNNGNNTVASELSDSQHIEGQVIRDAESEEKQPQRRKYRPRKKANPTEDTQPQRRKYRPRKKTNILPAEVGHSQETEMLDVDQHPSSRDRRTDPECRYFCIDKACPSSGEMGYRGFPTSSETQRHINRHSRHLKVKHFRCPLLHTDDRQRKYPRPDALRE